MKLNQILGISTFIVLAAVFAGTGLLAMEEKPSPLSSESEDIVRRLLEKKEKEIIEEHKNYSPWMLRAIERFSPGYGPDKKLEGYKEKYLRYEKDLDWLKQNFLTYEVAGSLSYTMSFDEIKTTVEAKLKKMYQNGQILTKDQFQKLNQDEWFAKGDGLSRIWGAEYLAKNFKKDNRQNIRVPKYIIVVDDLSKIRIKIWLGSRCFPIISTIENGKIYAEKISGTHRPPSNVGYGFTDYSGNNSVFTTEGVQYVIDTEYKSFYDGMPEGHLYGESGFLCEYLQERFELVNEIDGIVKIIELDLSEPR